MWSSSSPGLLYLLLFVIVIIPVICLKDESGDILYFSLYFSYCQQIYIYANGLGASQSVTDRVG